MRSKTQQGSQIWRQSVLITVGCAVFEQLRIPASIWIDGEWIAINNERSIVTTEDEHGVFSGRVAYNRRCLTEARRTRATVIGHYAGCTDLFVPVVADHKIRAFIVTGPYFSSAPTAESILKRWEEMTSRPGVVTDPEFARYLDQVLSTLVLDTKQAAEFQKTVERLARWIAGESPTSNVRSQARILASRVVGPRRVEYVWSAVEGMLDAQVSRFWKASFVHRGELRLPRMPERVAVGLFGSKRPDSDPIRERVARSTLQRSCVELALEQGGIISGRVGEHGITLLAVPQHGSRDALVAFAQRFSEFARRNHDLDVHWGVSRLAAPLRDQYHVALAAAELALARGVPLEFGNIASRRESRFAGLCVELQRLATEKPEALPPAFERLVQVVVERSHHRVEAASIYLDSAFELVSHAIAAHGKLETSAIPALRDELGRAVAEARSLEQVIHAHRNAIRELTGGLERPTEAHQDRSLRRALAYVHRRYTDPLSVEEVAKAAGFAPTYFSKLFHRLHGTTFVTYVRELRVKRAQELLRDTSLDLDRIAELSGLSTRSYLTRVFKQVTGSTPTSHRRAVRARMAKNEPPVGSRGRT
jgi:AraC-like DNA-binding protein